jgi:hypothetical protein
VVLVVDIDPDADSVEQAAAEPDRNGELSTGRDVAM